MQEIKDQLKKVIQDLYGLDFEPEITPAPANIDADYSTNAPLKLAKELHKSPMEIARELSETLAKNAFSGVTAPGFLNFTLPNEYLISKITELTQDFDTYISSDECKNKTIICEFSDPNPFKVLHVGHLYTSIVGDAISRLYEYAGAKVIRANFGGDVGLHVAKTIYALLRDERVTSSEGAPRESLSGGGEDGRTRSPITIEDIADCYVKGTAAYEDDAKAHQEITKLNKEIYRINAAGEHGRVTDLEGAPRPQPCEDGGGKPGRTRPENDLADLYWRGRELSYDYFKAFYADVGIKFDKFYPESTVAALGLQTVKNQLAKGVYELSNGAVIFDGEKYGLHTRVFINQEGVPTYEAKDVGLIFQKWDDYHFDKSIVITGNEQLEYMKVVLKSVEQYAPELVNKTTHLTHGLVKLPGNQKMSSRKGNFLKAVDVLEMVRQALKSEYDSNDDTVSLAATKCAFLKYKMGGNIIFDPKESVKMTGNSGPYLLYACVRAKKILLSMGKNELQNAQRVSICDNGSNRRSEPRNDGRERGGERVSILNSFERQLSKKILDYKSMLAEAVQEIAPHKVANFLYELAQEFSRFYEHCPVAGSDREAERIQIVRAYLSVMTHGLGILGINIPEEM